MAKVVTLKDIAEEMGVSVVTVSNSLSGKKGVSPATARAILEKAEEMGMDLSRYEQKLPENKTIGIYADKRYISIGFSFYWKIYQQLAHVASKKKCFTLLEISEETEKGETPLPKILTERGVDGLIILGVIPEKEMKRILEVCTVPLVLLDFYNYQYDAYSILSNNYAGGYRACEYLIDQGHREIGFVGTLGISQNVDERFMGYRKALAEHHIPYRKEYYIQDRKPITEEIILTLPEKLPTAFVACSDYAAEYLGAAIVKRGLSIPDDVSVVGYDNYLYQRPYSNHLTTYNVDMERMAKAAIRTLLKHTDRKEKKRGVKYIDSEMIIRGSVRKNE